MAATADLRHPALHALSRCLWRPHPGRPAPRRLIGRHQQFGSPPECKVGRHHQPVAPAAQQRGPQVRGRQRRRQRLLERLHQGHDGQPSQVDAPGAGEVEQPVQRSLEPVDGQHRGGRWTWLTPPAAGPSSPAGGPPDRTPTLASRAINRGRSAAAGRSAGSASRPGCAQGPATASSPPTRSSAAAGPLPPPALGPVSG